MMEIYIALLVAKPERLEGWSLQLASQSMDE